MTSLEIGKRMLDMFADILCSTETVNVKKFARTVTNKVFKLPVSLVSHRGNKLSSGY